MVKKLDFCESVVYTYIIRLEEVNMKINILTNYIDKRTGELFHGSQLSYYQRFKSGNFQKIQSFQCTQKMPFWNKRIVDGKLEIVRSYYNKEVIVAYVERVGNYD
jgi:hypothetical protein